MAVDQTVPASDSESDSSKDTEAMYNMYRYSDMLDTYVDVWKRNATDVNLEAVKSFEDVEKIVNSRRDLESANSMEDVVRLLTHRGVLLDAGDPGPGKTAGHGLRLLRRMILFTHAKAHAKNRRKLQWLVPTLLDLVENYEQPFGKLDLRDDDRLKDVQKKKTSNDERLPYDREVPYIRIKTPELSKRLQQKVFKKIPHRWQDVVEKLPNMKLIDILDAKSQRSPANGTDTDEEEQQFLNCLAFWIEEHPHVATWTNLLASIEKVDIKLREAVSALKSPS